MSKKQNDLSALDRVVKYISPESFNKRMIARIRSEILVQRSYEAAENNPQNSIRRSAKSANAEIAVASKPLREKGRDLERNAPYAKKFKDVAVNSTVGWGIRPSIAHKDPKRQAEVQEEYKRWADGLCSVDGKTDFYGQQREVFGASFTDGEVLSREVILNGAVRNQILEADFICEDRVRVDFEGGEVYSNGIIFDSYGRPKFYNLYNRHPGDSSLGFFRRNSSTLVPASELDLIFFRQRPGQSRGISWYAPVMGSINMITELQYTNLLRMKLSAAITAVVKKQSSTLPPDIQKAQREADWALNAGDVLFTTHDEDVVFPNIPPFEGLQTAIMWSLRESAGAIGLTYEAGSGDLTGINWSSYKAGDIHMRANVDAWRYHFLIPQFCEPSFERFLKHCRIKGIETRGITRTWTPPMRQMVNASEEIGAIKDAIRSGLQTLPDAIRELGYDFESHLQEIAKSNKLLDELGLFLDTDPRRITNGQLQSPDSLSGLKDDQANKKTQEQK